MIKLNKRWLLRIGFVAAAAGIAFLIWSYLQPKKLGESVASGNGRIDAEARFPPADVTIARIGDLLNHDLSTLQNKEVEP